MDAMQKLKEWMYGEQEGCGREGSVKNGKKEEALEGSIMRYGKPRFQ